MEASGSLVSGYLIKAVQAAGHIAVGSDITEWNHGAALCDRYLQVKPASDPDLWDDLFAQLHQEQIALVIPSLDETLAGWAEKAVELRERGHYVAISPAETIAICMDKWRTYEFFRSTGVPCPASSLAQDYRLVKPRMGRGGKGLQITDSRVDMAGMLSQEIVSGTEYTIDCLFDRDGQPVYTIPRRRIGVRDGKSTQGVVEHQPLIDQWVRHIARALHFVGPVNLQCFLNGCGDIWFIEINPRIAGGMALGMAASENWVPLIIANLMDGQAITPKPVRYGTRMARYYAECFISAG
ncbi:MAG: ATP-grasp domain-containing protein [Rhodothalassiaceae bacterium]